jgi:hypothetical protein
MARTFQPPVNLDDFGRWARSAELFQQWHEFIAGQMSNRPGASPAFFDPLNPPVAATPQEATPSGRDCPGL